MGDGGGEGIGKEKNEVEVECECSVMPGAHSNAVNADRAKEARAFGVCG